MCFLDEAEYAQAMIAGHIRRSESRSSHGVLIATFADCMQIAKFQKQFDDQIKAAQTGVELEDDEPVSIDSSGRIYWVNPGNGGEQVSLTRDEYLDVRERSFRDEIRRRLSGDYTVSGPPDVSVDGPVSTVSYREPEESYAFGDVAHRTPEGLSLAYTQTGEVEFRKLYTTGAYGTTLIDGLPLEANIEFSSRRPGREMPELNAVMDGFLAQQVTLNSD
jgi:hypothetical protein